MKLGFGTACAVFLLGGVEAQASVINLNPYYTNDLNIASANSGVAQIIYAPTAGELIARSSSAISVVNIANGTVSQEPAFANARFTDMSLAPSGNFLYAADFGGEVVGYGYPANQSYVHQLNLSTGNWSAELSPIAYNIQATSDSSFVLKTSDQWVTISTNSWTTGIGTSQQSSLSWSLYYGSIVYDPTTQRLIHGSSGSSSQEITAFRVVDGQFVRQETSGTYGSAQGNGGSLVLSSDNKSVYYGALQVEALDVTHNLRVFPEVIYSANSKYAFGNGDYYDAKTGVLLGKLGFDTTVYAQGLSGDDFWAYDGSVGQFRHFAPVPEASTFCLVALGFVGAICATRKSRKAQQSQSA